MRSREILKSKVLFSNLRVDACDQVFYLKQLSQVGGVDYKDQAR